MCNHQFICDLCSSSPSRRKQFTWSLHHVYYFITNHHGLPPGGCGTQAAFDLYDPQPLMSVTDHLICWFFILDKNQPLPPAVSAYCRSVESNHAGTGAAQSSGCFWSAFITHSFTRSELIDPTQNVVFRGFFNILFIKKFFGLALLQVCSSSFYSKCLKKKSNCFLGLWGFYLEFCVCVFFYAYSHFILICLKFMTAR